MAILGHDSACPIAHCLDVIGDRWALLIMREALRGETRFSGIQSALGIPRDVLTARLATLVDGGALARQSYQQPGQRARDEYLVTVAGRELFIILSALGEWGVRHAGGSTTLRFADATTGELVGARLATADGRIVDPQQVVAVTL